MSKFITLKPRGARGRLALVFAIAFALACLSLVLGACTSQEEKDAAALEEVELAQTTQYLEYSTKDVDPLSLIECTDEEVEVTTEDAIDLTEVGVQEITYRTSLGTASKDDTFTFTVRDTKSPEITLGEEKIEIDQGTSFDPASNITSVEDPVDGALSASSENLGATEDDPGYQKYYDAGWYAVEGEYDVNTPGTYELKVVACDVNGNRTTKTFSLVVNEVAPPEPEPEPAAAASQESTESASATKTQKTQADKHSYVLNTRSEIFHRPDCGSVKKMSAHNRVDVEMTRDEVIGAGYRPCQNCNP